MENKTRATDKQTERAEEKLTPTKKNETETKEEAAAREELKEPLGEPLRAKLAMSKEGDAAAAEEKEKKTPTQEEEQLVEGVLKAFEFIKPLRAKLAEFKEGDEAAAAEEKLASTEKTESEEDTQAKMKDALEFLVPLRDLVSKCKADTATILKDVAECPNAYASSSQTTEQTTKDKELGLKVLPKVEGMFTQFEDISKDLLGFLAGGYPDLARQVGQMFTGTASSTTEGKQTDEEDSKPKDSKDDSTATDKRTEEVDSKPKDSKEDSTVTEKPNEEVDSKRKDSKEDSTEKRTEEVDSKPKDSKEDSAATEKGTEEDSAEKKQKEDLERKASN